jgi:hypothetical protein
MAGLTEIEVKCALTTVRLDVSLKAPTVAVIVVDPLMLATEVEDEVQVTPLVKSAVEPSL